MADGTRREPPSGPVRPPPEPDVARPIRLMTLAPGHFHAALVQKTMPPGVHPRAYVYGPLDDDLVAHVARVAAFNARPDRPTAWELDVRAGGDYLARMLREQPGNVAVVAGRNKPKAGHLLAAVANNLPVLADKPWVVDPADFPELERVFREVDLRGGFAWDMMTERFEPTTALQRDLMRDPDVFGAPVPGTPADPGLTLDSVHYLRKTSAGGPVRRPVWWFDPGQAGVGLADVGTHLADLALWLLFPDQPVDYRREVAVTDAAVWPTPLSAAQFAAATGVPAFPPQLAAGVSGGLLLYRGNGTAAYTVRGVHVRITVAWDYEPPGGEEDGHEAVARGTNARVAVRTVAAPGGGSRRELSAAAADPARHLRLFAAVARRCQKWQGRYPGVSVHDRGREVVVHVPAALLTGHESHFAAVFREFAHYLRNPRQVPAWERANLLARYFMTTEAVKLAEAKCGPA